MNAEALQAKNNPSSQYLTFRVGDEIFGMDLSRTREVIEHTGVTSVPLMPDFINGVINLRGEVVPVIDLAIRLGRSAIEIRKRTCIVVIEIESDDNAFTLGLLADAVCEVNEIRADQIEEAPAFGASIRADFIEGIAKNGEDFIILLDATKALSIKELAKLIESEFTL